MSGFRRRRIFAGFHDAATAAACGGAFALPHPGGGAYPCRLFEMHWWTARMPPVAPVRPPTTAMTDDAMPTGSGVDKDATADDDPGAAGTHGPPEEPLQLGARSWWRVLVRTVRE